MQRAEMTSPGASPTCEAATSSRRDVKPRRAASVDNHDALDDAERSAGVDNDVVVRSAHSSPSRGRRKLAWLRKVIMHPVLIHSLCLYFEQFLKTKDNLVVCYLL